ncbi:Alpha/Beta hydrolase protein [Xylariaceae sp. FL0255]|nr:Alpha/Beta hydrolase protein [Xylariaceae sp. FL0255]
MLRRIRTPPIAFIKHHVINPPSRPSTLPCHQTRRSDLSSNTTWRRSIHLEGPALAPVVFAGLFVSLWTWKCFMMVVFQNKIIYMPGLPPNSRREKIEDYKSQLLGLSWREERMRAADGTRLALCVTDLPLGRSPSSSLSSSKQDNEAPPDRNFYILYFQGNASSIPPRLPDLSSVLNMLKRQMVSEHRSIGCSVICLSYRGYWTSKGRATERGIRLDAAAAMEWISQLHCDNVNTGKVSDQPGEVILWGQSIGCGVATNLAAERPMPSNLRLDSFVLETPFTSIRAMLAAMYPQKFLPYKYLWPFLRNHLDSWRNFGLIAERSRGHASSPPPEVLIVQAAKDELVPAELTQQLYDRCVELRIPVRMNAVDGAFHNDTMFRPGGRKAISQFLYDRMVNNKPP